MIYVNYLIKPKKNLVKKLSLHLNFTAEETGAQKEYVS